MSVTNFPDVARGTCEVVTGTRDTDQCGQMADYRYPARGGGHMRLCGIHGHKHADYSERWNHKDGWAGRGPDEYVHPRGIASGSLFFYRRGTGMRLVREVRYE